ncbi:hypothetical protein PPSIR1_16020 [Plesiocystis pacifica SIR-1]|uniref:Arrestin-like N-terminal domain-containing protein n=1 Tax=Plesiocystis pacifica SIR-1 TaxID=391625 RepID=A6GAT2_9BACT|nr:hypothetical protein PPSIR1_16020 [Plesiocystis pacifica SIR-1]
MKPKCDIHIEFDRTVRRFAPGEPITGAVVVSVDAETQCKALPLTLGWSTHGKGNRNGKQVARYNLFSGTWSPGTYRYPFNLPCPVSPLTYHGKLLNVDWYLTTSADVPWALDPKARQDLWVLPAQGSPFDLVQGESEHVENSAAGKVIGVIVMCMLGLIGLIPLGAALATFSPLMIVFSLLWWGVLGVIAWSVIKPRVAKSVFSSFDAQVQRTSAAHLAVSVHYRTQKRVNMITAKLEVEEVVVHGAGTNRTTHRELRYSDPRPVMVNATGQQHHQFAFQLPDPALVGFSFGASDNDLVWKVVLDCDIEQWPDLEETIPLQVRPRPVASLGGYR